MEEKKIKLLTLWQLKTNYSQNPMTDDTLISHGIWEVIGIKDLSSQNPIAVMKCRLSSHNDLKVGIEREVFFILLRTFCEEVVIMDVDDIMKEMIRYKKLKRVLNEK